MRQHNPALPSVFFDDAAVTRGDGVFETILIRDAAPANLRRHLDRFIASAALLDLPAPDPNYWAKATAEAARAWAAHLGDGPIPDAQCTWTYTRGRAATGIPSAWLTVRGLSAEQLRQRETGVAVMTSPRGYTIDAGAQAVPWLTLGAKTLNYAATMAALRWAKKHGCDDVIYTDGQRVLEGATSTVVVVRKGNKLRTPTPGGDVLVGTTQDALFEYAAAHGWRCKTRELTVADLLSAESVWLVSSVRTAARVTRIDDHDLPAPANEAQVRALIDAALAQA